MRTFAQKPKAAQQTGPTKSATPGRTHSTRDREVDSSLYLQRTIGNPAVQPLLQEDTGDVKGDATATRLTHFGHDFSRIPVHAATGTPIQPKLQVNATEDAYAARSTEEVNDKKEDASKAGMGIVTLADWLPQTRGTGAESVIVFPASGVADRDGANAVTLGRAVHLSSDLSRLQPAEQRRVLAHEAVHVAQHAAPGPSAPRESLEIEAHQLSPQVLSGHRVQPRFHADAMTALADDGGPLPNDIIAVRKAKARREVLLRWKAIYEGGNVSNLATERQDILDKRERLDDSMKKNLEEGKKKLGFSREVKDYREEERQNLAALNRKPTTLEVTTTSVRIRVRFQVRFEGLADKEAKEKFPVLQRNLQQGVSDIWNQRLKGAVLPGRTFEVVPELELVSQTAARDENFWLITVRPTDKGPMVYGTTKLGDAPGGVPTSVTSAKLDGGVMSIPPSTINEPGILGHETLHLFGLADRYLILPISGKPENFGLRETGGRNDPLGADEEGKVKGKILEEDLGFVLDQFGVYPTIPYSDVVVELRKVDEIIKTGRDPDSLIRKRKNFEQETIKQVEDLP